MLSPIEKRFLNGREGEYYSLVSPGNYEHIKPKQLAQHTYEITGIMVRPGGGAPVAIYSVAIRNIENDLENSISGTFAESWIPALGEKKLGINIFKTGPSELKGYGPFSSYLTETFGGARFDGVAIDFSEEQWKEHREATNLENHIPGRDRIMQHREWISQQFQKSKKLDLPIGVLI